MPEFKFVTSLTLPDNQLIKEEYRGKCVHVNCAAYVTQVSVGCNDMFVNGELNNDAELEKYVLDELKKKPINVTI